MWAFMPSSTPNKFRMEIENVFTIILNGDQGWFVSMGNANDMTKEQIAEAKENRYSENTTRLLPLTKGDDYKIDVLPEGKVGVKPAVGVKVSSKGHRDVKLFFDKENGLLVKAEFKVKDDQSGIEVNQEAVYSDYKDVDGLKFPTKVVIKRDGNQFVEAELSDMKLVDKLDDKTFAKP